MSGKTPVLTSKAPKPLPGIYSQAIIANGFVYCSGAVPMDAETGKIIDGDIKAHTVCTFDLCIGAELTLCSTNALTTSEPF